LGFLFIIQIHLDSTVLFLSWSVLLLQLLIIVSYVANAIPLTGKARMQSNRNPRKKLIAPPLLYVFFAQSHAPLYNGCTRLSVMILDLITSNGNTKTQLSTPKLKSYKIYYDSKIVNYISLIDENMRFNKLNGFVTRYLLNMVYSIFSRYVPAIPPDTICTCIGFDSFLVSEYDNFVNTLHKCSYASI